MIMKSNDVLIANENDELVTDLAADTLKVEQESDFVAISKPVDIDGIVPDTAKKVGDEDVRIISLHGLASGDPKYTVFPPLVAEYKKAIKAEEEVDRKAEVKTANKKEIEVLEIKREESTVYKLMKEHESQDDEESDSENETTEDKFNKHYPEQNDKDCPLSKEESKEGIENNSDTEVSKDADQKTEEVYKEWKILCDGVGQALAGDSCTHNKKDDHEMIQTGLKEEIPPDITKGAINQQTMDGHRYVIITRSKDTSPQDGRTVKNVECPEINSDDEDYRNKAGKPSNDSQTICGLVPKHYARYREGGCLPGSCMSFQKKISQSFTKAAIIDGDYRRYARLGAVSSHVGHNYGAGDARYGAKTHHVEFNIAKKDARCGARNENVATEVPRDNARHGARQKRITSGKFDPGGGKNLETFRSPGRTSNRNTWRQPHAQDTCNDRQLGDDRHSEANHQGEENELLRIVTTVESYRYIFKCYEVIVSGMLILVAAMFKACQLEGEAKEYVERRQEEDAAAAYEENQVAKAVTKVLDWLHDNTVVSCVPDEQSRRGSMRPQHCCRCSSGKNGEAPPHESKLNAYRKDPGVAGVQGGDVSGLGANYWVVCGQRTAEETSMGRSAIRKAREVEREREQARDLYKRRDEATKAYIKSEKGQEEKQRVMEKVKEDLGKLGIHVSKTDPNNNDVK